MRLFNPLATTPGQLINKVVRKNSVQGRIDMASNPAIPGDIVAQWKIHLPDGVHDVEFEHGTTSGKRVIRVDGNEVRHHNRRV